MKIGLDTTIYIQPSTRTTQILIYQSNGGKTESCDLPVPRCSLFWPEVCLHCRFKWQDMAN